ncbi:DNA-processing protein DprA [Aquibacillus sediminis]|uniref:DNA-processing protein DprA n=1 Tax=Aquibacillus sediminis TaxID=2574734 RepID=UPI0011087E15|nr:DNA-processing protein DprA [Aquibacillus sediminis]
MDKRKLTLLHLHRARGVTRVLIRNILRKDSQLTDVYRWTSHQWQQYFSLDSSRASIIYADLHNREVFTSLIYDLKKFQVLTIFDSGYPPLLRHIQDPPYVLYLLGNSKLFYQLPSLSVVGTRNPTSEAKQKINHIIRPLARKGWIVVSGMAVGIDGLAHQMAIEQEGKTIAVLGSGFRHIYPQQHNQLFQSLVATQLVVSEYTPNTPPRKYHFPERNRIISGLSFGTIVIEAKQKSGSLITVNQALDQGREVYAIPGSPLHPQTHGCHQMIQDGAKLVQNTYDLLEEWEQLGDKWCQIMSDFKENASYTNG